MSSVDDRHDVAATLRRVFVHGLVLLGVLLTGAGCAGLLRVALERAGGRSLAGDSAEGLALGLSLLLVGLPVWLLAEVAARRGVARAAGEAWSLPRRLQLVAVRAVALTLTVVYAFDVGAWLLGLAPHDPTAVARLVVWSAVWAHQERIAGGQPFGSQRTGRLDRVHVYLASAVGLLLLGGGLGSAMTRSLETLYDRLVRPGRVLVASGTGLREAAVSVVVGAAVWWWHWGHRGRGDRGSTGWHVTLFLVGVLGGAAVAVTAASTLVFTGLAWLLGAVEGDVADHFDVAPGAFAALVVGLAAWAYHRTLLRERRPRGVAAWSGPERTYQHLLVAVGVLTTAGGVATVLALGLELALPARTLAESADPGRRALAAGLTLLAVGTPMWAAAWVRIQRTVRRDPRERTSTARRALILGVFGAGALAAIGALATVLYAVLDALFSGWWSRDVLADQRWSLAVVVTAGVIAAHYLLVLREDRRAVHEAEPREEVVTAPTRITVVASRPGALARALADDLDTGVDAWTRRGDGGTRRSGADAIDPVALAAELRGLAAPEALVVVAPDGAWEVIPVDRRSESV